MGQPKQQKLLPSGNATTQSMEQVAKTKGTGNERGQAHNKYLKESHGEGEKAVHTKSGDRVHDGRDTKASKTDLRIEGKNYLIYRGTPGEKGGVPQSVPLSSEIRLQAIKDSQWIRAGKREGIDRHVQWEFAGAPPSAELANFLSRLKLSYVIFKY